MFEYLKSITDSTGNVKKTIKRCDEAQSAIYAAKNENKYLEYSNAVKHCSDALNIMIKLVYNVANLEAPSSHMTHGKISDADRMRGDSPFAKWIGNKNVVNYCNDIRMLRNRVVHKGAEDSRYRATEQEADKCIKKLDVCLKAISNKIPKVKIMNPGDRHQACVILLDTSGSMNGAPGTPVGKRPIDELNSAIKEFKSAIENVEEANACTEICLITFADEVDNIQSFRNADRFNISPLSAGGLTSMNKAIEMALDVIEQQKNIYKERGVFYYRPWLFLFSDGVPTDKGEENNAKSRLQRAIEEKHVIFFPTSIGGWADKKFLSTYYPNSVPEGKRIVLAPKKGEFRNAFRWLSNSLIAGVKNAKPKFDLPEPEGFTIERY